MLWQTTGEKTGADQKFEPANTNGEPKPNGHATDSTYPCPLTCPGTSDHYTPEPVQDRTRRHGRKQP